MAVIAPKAVAATPVRSVSILGSTGSVGCNTVDLLRRDPESFRVEALTANHNVGLLAAQAPQLGASLAVVAVPGRYGALKEALSGTGIEAAADEEVSRQPNPVLDLMGYPYKIEQREWPAVVDVDDEVDIAIGPIVAARA